MAKQEFKKVDKLFSKLTGEKQRKFPKSRGYVDAPDHQGVYIIYSPSGRVLHVGSTPRARKGIAQRLRNHLANQSSFTAKYLKGHGSRLRNGYKFACLVVPDVRQRALLEALAIGRLCPAHIGIGHSALGQIDK